jgi:single-strand DNA-binding protein
MMPPRSSGNWKEEGIMINKAILVGRLGADPEVRYTPDGLMVTNFNMATDETRKDKNGERVQKTEWHRIVTFGKLAEICGNYLAKGKLIYLEGRIQTRAWEDKDGIKRSTTEIVASDMKMLDGKGQVGSSTGAAATDRPPQSFSPESLPDDDVPF